NERPEDYEAIEEFADIVNDLKEEDEYNYRSLINGDEDANQREKEREKREQEKKVRKQKEEEKKQALNAFQSALALEILGDLPSVDIKPPDNVLFVRGLNRLTEDKGLQKVFETIGKVVSCNIIKNKISNRSKCYGFVEYDTKEEV
ncbi:MAG: hypothetical protein EZS28_038549, partial [Streblomastix strix]